MKTIQGKEFNLEDILLYKKMGYDIILFVDDKEQIEKYLKSNSVEDLPLSRVLNTQENEEKIVSNMKKISSYEKISGKKIKVTYDDKTTMVFDAKEEETINNIIELQKPLKKKTKKTRSKKTTENIVMPIEEVYKEEEHEVVEVREATTEEKTNKKSGSRWLSTVLATLLLAGATYGISYYAAKNSRLKLTDEESDYINGLYPIVMEEMTEEQRNEKAREILANIQQIIATNLSLDTKEEDMLDFSSYIETKTEREIVEKSMNLARNVVEASNKSERELEEAVTNLMNYEFDTINNPDFLTMPSGTRYLITEIFRQVDSYIPRWSFVERKSSEMDTRKYDLYYFYFRNDTEDKTYFPERYKENDVLYVYTDRYCAREAYTEDEMLAMAGLLSVNEQVQLGVMANSSVHILGLRPEIVLRNEEAQNEFINLKDTFILTK